LLEKFNLGFSFEVPRDSAHSDELKFWQIPDFWCCMGCGSR